MFPTPLPKHARLEVLAQAGIPHELLETACAWNTRSLLTVPADFPKDEEPHAPRWHNLLTTHGENTRAMLELAYPALIQAPALTAPPRIHLAQTLAGCIPVITAANRADFETLLRTLGYHGRDIAIPPTVGAMYLNGVLHGTSGEKDRLILLSRGGYAGLSPSQAGFPPGIWEKLSLELREYHELAHYSLLRLRGSLAKNLTEELIADAEALRAATGHCPADLLQKILGLTTGTPLPAARFTWYLPTSLTTTAPAWQTLLLAACRTLSKAAWDVPAPENRLLAMARLSLEDLAFGEMEPRL